MPVETATYITQLNAANPLGSDERSTIDDHMRLLKQVLLNTLTNLNAAVTASSAELNLLDGATMSTAELNYLVGVTSSIQDQLDALGLNVGQMLGSAAVRTFSYAAQNVAEDITVPVGQNAMAPGPVTIADTFTVLISDGSTLTIV